MKPVEMTFNQPLTPLLLNILYEIKRLEDEQDTEALAEMREIIQPVLLPEKRTTSYEL